MKNIIKFIKWLIFSATGLLTVLILGLGVYTMDSSNALDEMYDEISLLDTEGISLTEYFDTYKLEVINPKGNIIIIPGGKVHSDSYLYLSYLLAIEGYQVYLNKAVFQLAILTPNRANKFLDDNLENIIIGHSLGGTVGGMVSSGDNSSVSKLILLASYTTNNIKSSDVLLITGENDLVLNKDKFNNSLSKYSNYIHHEITGANHSGFGWYGDQKGDGIATITTHEQQLVTFNLIRNFIS